jgi:hypothetical protein
MRTREQIIKDGLTKVVMVIDDMKKLHLSGTITKMVRINGSLSLEINDIRDDDPESLFYGQNAHYEIYAIKNGKAVDCMTINIFRNLKDDVYYLLNCYA